MAAAKELFLSYGHEPEVISFVKRLKHNLEARGLSVWMDTEDIPAGCDWHGAIGTGLDQCKAIIAVITNKYINSKFCTRELYTASSDQKLIYPIIFEDVDFSSSEKARGVKFVIGSINWTKFRPQHEDYHESLEKLFHGMREHGLGGGTPSVVDGPISDQSGVIRADNGGGGAAAGASSGASSKATGNSKHQSGKSTPQYKHVLKNMVALVDTLAVTPKATQNLSIRFIQNNWLNPIVKDPTAVDLIKIVLNRIKEDASQYDELRDMLSDMEGMDLLLKKLPKIH